MTRLTRLVALLLPLLVAACPIGLVSAESAGAATSGTGTPSWIVADWAVAKMQKAGLSPGIVTSLFDNPRTYLIVTHAGDSFADKELPLATRVERFTSYATLRQAVDAGALMSGTKAVLYDNERWSFTPTGEQDAPVHFAAEAEGLAHRHGLAFLFTPAVNLAAASGSKGAATGSKGAATGSKGAATGSKYSAYLSKHLAGQGAKVSDVFDVQAQQAEATPEFASFVTAAVRQARAANPRATVDVGIGPNPDGRVVTSQDLVAAYRSTRAEAAGYWLNLPAANAQCPQCGAADPQEAVQFLEAIAQSPAPAGQAS